MSTLKPGSPTSWQDCLTIQQSGSTNYCPGTGSCNSSPKQRQHNAPPEKIEPFTRGAKRMDTDQVAETYNVLALDARVFRRWARLMHRRPHELIEDAMIAATAEVHNLIVVTRNVRDFEQLGIRTLNPFGPSPV